MDWGYGRLAGGKWLLGFRLNPNSKSFESSRFDTEIQVVLCMSNILKRRGKGEVLWGLGYAVYGLEFTISILICFWGFRARWFLVLDLGVGGD